MLFYPGSRLSNLVHLPLYQTASCQFPGGILPSPDRSGIDDSFKRQGGVLERVLGWELGTLRPYSGSPKLGDLVWITSPLWCLFVKKAEEAFELGEPVRFLLQAPSFWSLKWLLEIQLTEKNFFSPVSTPSFTLWTHKNTEECFHYNGQP